MEEIDNAAIVQSDPMAGKHKEFYDSLFTGPTGQEKKKIKAQKREEKKEAREEQPPQQEGTPIQYLQVKKETKKFLDA